METTQNWRSLQRSENSFSRASANQITAESDEGDVAHQRLGTEEKVFFSLIETPLLKLTQKIHCFANPNAEDRPTPSMVSCYYSGLWTIIAYTAQKLMLNIEETDENTETAAKKILKKAVGCVSFIVIPLLGCICGEEFGAFLFTVEEKAAMEQQKRKLEQGLRKFPKFQNDELLQEAMHITRVFDSVSNSIIFHSSLIIVSKLSFLFGMMQVVNGHYGTPKPILIGSAAYKMESIRFNLERDELQAQTKYTVNQSAKLRKKLLSRRHRTSGFQ